MQIVSQAFGLTYGVPKKKSPLAEAIEAIGRAHERAGEPACGNADKYQYETSGNLFERYFLLSHACFEDRYVCIWSVALAKFIHTRELLLLQKKKSALYRRDKRPRVHCLSTC